LEERGRRRRRAEEEHKRKNKGEKKALTPARGGGQNWIFFFVVYSVAQCFTACLSRRCVFFLLSFARAFFAQLSYHSIYPRTTDVCFVRLKSHWQQCGFYLLLFFFFCGLFFCSRRWWGDLRKKEQVRMKHSTALHFIVFLLLLYLFVGGVLCSVVFPVVHFNFFSFSFTSLLSYIASLSDRNCYLLLFQCSFVVYNNGIVSTLFSLPPFLHEIVKSTGARGCGRDFFSASFTLHVSCPVLWVCLVDPEDDIQEVRPETQKKEGGEREKEWKRLQII